jgi:CRISPR-associated exonuclease Cas4
MNITGTQICEYFKCKRQLSLNLNKLTFYDDCENIELGKIIEETTYTRRNKVYKNFDIGGSVVDYIDFKKRIIYETKKSSKHIQFYQYQLKYYLYLLNDDFKGIIEIPKEKKKIEIVLTDDDRKLLETAIKDIQNIFDSKKIIKEKKNKNFCKGCAFYKYCWI